MLCSVLGKRRHLRSARQVHVQLWSPGKGLRSETHVLVYTWDRSSARRRVLPVCNLCARHAMGSSFSMEKVLIAEKSSRQWHGSKSANAAQIRGERHDLE